jgi:hypothetical protein
MALDLLADDVAVQAPRYRHYFSKRALELLASPPEAITRRLAYVLRDACEAHPPTRLMVDNAIDRALAGGPGSVAAVMVLIYWEEGTGALAFSARQRLHRLVRGLDQHQRRRLAPLAELYPRSPLQALAGTAPAPKPRSGRLSTWVRPHLRTGGLDADSAHRAELLLERLQRVRIDLQEPGSALHDVVYEDGLPDDGGALADPAVQDAVVTAVDELAARDWHAAGVMCGVLDHWIARRPVGDQLADLLQPARHSTVSH